MSTSWSSSGDNSFDSAAKSTADSFNSALIVSVVISSIATVAIVIAIIYCLKKAAKTAPTYAQVTIGQANQTHPTAQANALYSHQPSYPVITNSELEAATMEKFLSNMAKERPLRFSTQQLTDFTHHFSSRLGSGGFGVVYKGVLPNGVPIAVKVLNSNLGKRLEEQFMAEVATIGRTYHINLVRLYGFCFDPNLHALVYEYMENGSLDKFLFTDDINNHSNYHNQIRFEKLHEIALGTAKGIAYLHEECQQRIIHYDIKPGNVLLDSKLNPKVADFGLAKLYNRDSTHVQLSGIKGTPGYAAPEVWMPFPVTHKCDVYSFGILLFEIVGRRRHRAGGALSGTSREWLPRWVYEKVERKEVAEMLTDLGIDGEDREKAERAAMVALWCVQYLPTARPNMSDVVRMLEGGVEIPPPPNPFAHLGDGNLGGSFPGGGSSGQTPLSSSTWESSSDYSNQTYPQTYEKRMGTLDIVTC